MIYITGDIHGDFTDYRLTQMQKMSSQDTVIFLGDFGFDWDPDHIKRFNVPCKVLFLAGNHENYSILNNLPEIEMFEDKVGILKENVYFLKTGHIYNIANKKVLIFGGAVSIDKAYRLPYRSWWPEEVPSWEVLKEAKSNLKANDNKVDYFLTHTCSSSTSKSFFNYSCDFKDVVEDMIEELEQQIEGPYIHYFGHHHTHKEKDNQICLYKDMVKFL